MKSKMPCEPLTLVEAKVDVGLGNALYIRGQGDGLSWDKGQRLIPGFGGSWIWKSTRAKGRVLFKLLLNDKIRAKGEDIGVEAGKMIEVAPVF
jgi:hypothetical protein